MEDDKTVIEEPTIGYSQNYTYGDYLKFDYEYMVELIRGKIYKMSPAPSMKHQEVIGEFHVSFANHFKKKQCKVFIAPLDVVLPIQNRKNKKKNTTVVQPDLVVVCDPSILDEAGCFGVPDLLVEAISPHTKKKDIRLKYEIYEEVGVKEYWVVYPLEKVMDIYVIENGKYVKKGTFMEGDIISPSMIPGLKIDLDTIFDY